MKLFGCPHFAALSIPICVFFSLFFVFSIHSIEFEFEEKQNKYFMKMIFWRNIWDFNTEYVKIINLFSLMTALWTIHINHKRELCSAVH